MKPPANLQKKPYSERSAYSFKKVERQGIPELVEAVRAGRLAVSCAARIAELPAEEQARLLTLGRIELRAELGKKPRQDEAQSIEGLKACVRRIVEMTGWVFLVSESWFDDAAKRLLEEGFTVRHRDGGQAVPGAEGLSVPSPAERMSWLMK